MELRCHRFSTNLYFGTCITAELWTPDCAIGRRAAASAWRSVLRVCSLVQEAASPSRVGSWVHTFNHAPGGSVLEIDGIVANLLEAAGMVWKLSGGAYDPTVGPLVDLWGFSACCRNRNHGRDTYLSAPPEATVRSVRELVGFDKLEIRTNGSGKREIRKRDAAVTVGGITYTQQLDLGGLAKGYAADMALDAVRTHGIEYGYLNFGGSEIAVLAHPSTEDGIWRVPLGVGDPSAVVRTRDTIVTTSSETGHLRTDEGHLASHIIDPRTGYPASWACARTQGAVLVGQPSALADGIATALCVLAPNEARALLGNETLMGNYDVTMVEG